MQKCITYLTGLILNTVCIEHTGGSKCLEIQNIVNFIISSHMKSYNNPLITSVTVTCKQQTVKRTIMYKQTIMHYKKHLLALSSIVMPVSSASFGILLLSQTTFHILLPYPPLQFNFGKSCTKQKNLHLIWPIIVQAVMLAQNFKFHNKTVFILRLLSYTLNMEAASSSESQ
jgi:hypothetical protein